MMLVGAEKFSALLAHSRTPCGVRLFRRVECAQVHPLAVDRYPSDKPRFLVGLLHAARQVSPLACLCVPAVLLASDNSQIYESIVCLVAISVVDFFRPFSSLHRPDNLMYGRSENVVHGYDPIAVSAHGSDFVTGVTPVPDRVAAIGSKMVPWSRLPEQRTRFWIIAEAFVQMVCGRQPFHWEPCL